MYCFYLLTFVSIVSVTKGNSVQVKGNENYKISSYVKALIDDFNIKDPTTKDVAIFRLSKFQHTKKKVDDLVEDVLISIPKTVVVSSPPLIETENDDFQIFSFVIVVSDVLAIVSIVISNYSDLI